MLVMSYLYATLAGLATLGKIAPTHSDLKTDIPSRILSSVKSPECAAKSNSYGTGRCACLSYIMSSADR